MTGKRILLVEDEALVALYTEDVLTEGGYTIVGQADRLDTAVTFAQTESLDAAILDVNLAGVHVWPVADVLHGRGIPFVLLTGFGAEIPMPAVCRGAPCLGKPFASDMLLDALATVLRRADRRSQPHSD